MNAKTLKVLAVVTVVVVLAAVASQQFSGIEVDSEPLPERVMPALEGRINDVVHIEVVSGGETLALGRREGSWVVESKAGYPAKFETVKQALVSLADLEPRERKTSDAARYERVGLSDPAEGNEAVRVALRDDTGEEIGGVVLGEEVFEGGTSQRYVRTLSDPQAWLAEGRVNVPTDPMQWLEREIVRIPRDRVNRVTITHSDGEVISIAREQGGTDYTLDAVPEGRIPKSPSEVGAPASALSALRLDDVRAASEPGMELAEPTTALYELDNGLKLTVQTWDVEGTTWAKLHAEAPPEAEEPAEPGADSVPAPATDAAEPQEEQAQAGDSPEAEDAAEASTEAATEDAPPENSAAEEAEEINDKVSGWLYALPSYQATSLRKRVADLTTEPEPAGDVEAGGEEAPEPPFIPSLDAKDDPDGG